MNGVRFTLLGDGTSDRILEHPIRWAMRAMQIPIERADWADFGHLKRKPRGLAERASAALELYPADLLFIHRDAERESWADRADEISRAASHLAGRYVAVIPVRMTEAWFLHDEAAIRSASGNPNGKAALKLPGLQQAESVPDPKAMLRAAFLSATELSGRRLKKKNSDREFGAMRTRAAQLVDDFGPLLALPSFRAFLDELAGAVSRLGYVPTPVA